MIPLATFALTGCLVLTSASDTIRAGDLAQGLPAWLALAADTPIVPAPIPGATRVIRAAELRRLALRWNVPASAEAGVERDLCFAIPVMPPDPARLLAAMQRRLPAARIEILEASRQPAPDGEFEFPLSGLHPTPNGGYWNGYVAYGHNRRFAVWARVKVMESSPRVVAAEALKAGSPLVAAQLRVETQESFPSGASFVPSMADAIGRIPRRSIAAGAAIRPEWLEAPKDIQRGDTVQVDVIQGGAHLRLEGVAQAGGTIGETIAVENPASKRRFPARVAAKGQVVVKGTL
jgi:flagella basal body P-ring formation protein FlgA